MSPTPPKGRLVNRRPHFVSPWERKLLEQLPREIERIVWPCAGARDRSRLLERVQVLGFAVLRDGELFITDAGQAKLPKRRKPAAEEPAVPDPPAPKKKRGRKA